VAAEVVAKRYVSPFRRIEMEMRVKAGDCVDILKG
jgi:hypothetical protein